MNRKKRIERLERVSIPKVIAVTYEGEPGVVQVSGVRMTETAFREKYGFGGDIVFLHVTFTDTEEDGKDAWWADV